MSTFGVVLDACVLIPAPLRDTLLRAAELGMYRLHWSELILAEVKRNLIKRGMTSPVDAQELIDVMSRSQVIVTSNIKDFPDTALAPFGIEAQTPDEFLTHLFDLSPKYMIKILTEQAQDLVDPPMSVQEVLEDISLHAPRFVSTISPLILEQG